MKYILLFGLLLLCCLAEIPDPPRPKGHPKRKKAGKQTVPMPEHFKERREAAERMRKQRIEARKAAQGTGQLEVGHPVPEGFREVRVGPEGSMFRSVARCMHIFETPTNHSEFKNWFDASAEAVAGRKPGESGVLWTKQLVFKMLLEAYTSGRSVIVAFSSHFISFVVSISCGFLPRYDDEISAAAAKMDLDSEAYIKHLSKEKKGGDLELSTLSKELKVDILLYRDTDEPGQEPQMFAAGHSSGRINASCFVFDCCKLNMFFCNTYYFEVLF